MGAVAWSSAACGYSCSSSGRRHARPALSSRRPSRPATCSGRWSSAACRWSSLIAVSSIGAERGTLADSVLSRGISRYQYFLAKWHARLGVTVGTFVLLAAGVLATYAVVFTGALTGGGTNLTFLGGVLGVLVLAAGLAVVVSWGVTIGALANGTVTGITLFWVVLFGGLLVLSQLPDTYPTPERMLGELKRVLSGTADGSAVSEFVLGSVALSAAAGVIGLVGFSRRDV